MDLQHLQLLAQVNGLMLLPNPTRANVAEQRDGSPIFCIPNIFASFW